ncbi:MAG: DUF2911 domain-containing protein [Holophagales bacterium]|jgi:hypothetical protein|nr:DUF2911 domain-containing protein [Holophagales bacterium]MBK9965859.1 DUF2911 domain-containing protein [Holophagales bacterium]
MRQTALSAVLLLLSAATPLAAELRLPQPSPAATVSTTIGTTDVSIRYHQPAVKGRQVWGELVPYGSLWRLGANNATTVSFTDPVKVAGRDVPAGTYALFAIPGKESWTLVLNRKAQQWGAYFADPKEDQLRFDVKPVAGEPTEWMTFGIVPTGATSARVDWAWEKLRFSFPVEVEVSRLVWAGVDKALAEAKPDDWQTPLQAARWARQDGKRLDEAVRWLDRSIAARESFWNYELKALFLHDAGKTAEAIPLMEKAIEIAKKGGPPKEYTEGLEKTLASWQAPKR